MLRFCQLVFGIVVLGTAPGPAAALTFSFTTVAGDTLSTAQASAFATAANAWSSTLTDNITVNLQIGFASLSEGVLGQTTPVFLTGSASAIDSLLAADAKGAYDSAAVASLATETPTTIAVTRPEAKALGAPGIGPGTDGAIEFSTNYAFSTQRNVDGSTPANTYDLTGIAEHEIGHVLGFDSSIDGGTSFQTLLDQFRFSAPNTRSVTAGAPAFFTINDGLTNIANFSIGGAGNYQASHWLQGTGGLMDPAVATGVSKNITPLDTEALDVLGYDIAVPEPDSLALILVGLVALMRSRQSSRTRIILRSLHNGDRERGADWLARLAHQHSKAVWPGVSLPRVVAEGRSRRVISGRDQHSVLRVCRWLHLLGGGADQAGPQPTITIVANRHTRADLCLGPTPTRT